MFLQNALSSIKVFFFSKSEKINNCKNISDEQLLSITENFARKEIITMLIDRGSDLGHKVNLDEIDVEFEDENHDTIRLSLPPNVREIIKKSVKRNHLYIDVDLE